MKYLTGSILLIVVLILPGCGKSKPAGAGLPRAPLLTQQEIDEKHAANFLESAKDFQEDGHPKYAANILEELLEQFPDTKAADEAKQILAEIEENQPNGGNSE